MKGTSIDKAIVLDATMSIEAIKLEYEILEKMFGERGKKWILEKQTLLENEGKYYDMINIQLNNGEKISIFFDITLVFSRN